MKDYYYLFGLKNDCSQEDIKKAYRELSVKFHPDKNDGKSYYSQRFQDINEANEILSNPIKRAEYDRKLNSSFKEKDFENQSVKNQEKSPSNKNEKSSSSKSGISEYFTFTKFLLLVFFILLIIFYFKKKMIQSSSKNDEKPQIEVSDNKKTKPNSIKKKVKKKVLITNHSKAKKVEATAPSSANTNTENITPETEPTVKVEEKNDNINLESVEEVKVKKKGFLRRLFSKKDSI